MSSSTCSFKKDTRKYKIRCRYNCDCTERGKKEHDEKFYHVCKFDLKCTDFSASHRKSCPHSTFNENPSERLKFLLKSARYAATMRKSKEKENTPFNSFYLSEQFSCDFLFDEKKELHREFLIECLEYIKQNLNSTNKSFIEDLMIIQQALTTLEENAITGIYYLNRSFMMWIFNMNSISELNDFLKDRLSIDALYGLHFKKLLDILKTTRVFQNKQVAEMDLDLDKLKRLYATFMLGRFETFQKSRKRTRDTADELDYVRNIENEIIIFLKEMNDDKNALLTSNYEKNNSSSLIPILNISNTSVNNIIDKILKSRGITDDDRIDFSL